MNAATPMRRSSPQRLAENVVDEADVATLRLEEENVERTHRQRPYDRSPQARDTAHDEHRERQEREVEVDVARLQCSSKVYKQPSRKARERPR